MVDHRLSLEWGLLSLGPITNLARPDISIIDKLEKDTFKLMVMHKCIMNSQEVILI